MGIVRPQWSNVNDIWLFGQVSGAEEEPPTIVACSELAEAMQTSEVVAGVTGASSRFLETEEGFVLAGKHGVHVCEHFVAEFRPVYLGAETGKLVAAGAPAGDEIVARHVRMAAESGKTKVVVLIESGLRGCESRESGPGLPDSGARFTSFRPPPLPRTRRRCPRRHPRRECRPPSP